MLKIPVLKMLRAYKVSSEHWNIPSRGTKEQEEPWTFAYCFKTVSMENRKLQITYFNHTNLLFYSIEIRAPETLGFSCELHVARVRWKFPMYIYKAVVPVERVRRSCAAALPLP